MTTKQMYGERLSDDEVRQVMNAISQQLAQALKDGEDTEELQNEYDRWGKILKARY